MKKITNFIAFCAGCMAVVVTGEICLGMVEAGYDKIRAFIKHKKETPETKSRRWFCREYEEDTSDDDTVVKGFAAR